jgi:diacylglycerol kinase (ATP)
VGGVAVISNPRSRVNQRNPRLVRNLAYVLGDSGELIQPPDLDHLEATVRQLRERAIDVVCVSGGDGTLHKVLSALVRVYAGDATGEALRAVRLPKVAILKTGTLNTVARNVGVKADAREMLGHVVHAWGNQSPLRTTERNAIFVNREHAGFIFGIGVLARYMERYYAGGTTGPVKALRVFFSIVLSTVFRTRLAREMFRLEPLVVTMDGHRWAPPEYACVSVGTVDDLGLGWEMYHRAARHPDHMHALGFHCPPTSVFLALHRIYLGRPMDRPDIIDQVCHELVIESQEPINVMMDGDFMRCGSRLMLETGPRVRFVVA